MFELCVRGAVEEEDRSPQKKEEERHEKEVQYEEQLKEVSFLQSSPYKPTMVVEVCCHRDELLTVVKVCYLY